MKLLSIKCENLASLAGEQVIDFTKEPLKSSGLIAITGRTGSGKSTLLDALCLALYDQIPRFNYSEMSKEAKLLDKSSGETLSSKDTRQILRRGTAFGYAEVEFIALDQKHYRSRWQISRSRKKVTGKLQKIERSIQCVDDGTVLTQKISECNPLIERLIGLNFSQFTRAVLLAQSEVGAFLKAKDQERANLLEYLTDSNIFSLIGKKAYEQAKYYREQLETQSQVLDLVELLSDEQRQELQQQVQQLNAHIKQEQTQLQHWQQQLLHYQQYQQITQQLDEKQQHQAQLQAQEMDIQHDQDTLKTYQEIQHIYPVVQQWKQCQLKLQTTQQQLKYLQQAYQQTEIDYQQQCQAQQLSQHAYDTLQHYVNQHAESVQQAIQFEEKCQFLREQYRVEKQQLDQLQNPLSQLNSEIAQSDQQIQALTHQQTTLQEQLKCSEYYAWSDDEPRIILQHMRQYRDQYQQLIQQYSVDHLHALQELYDEFKQDYHQFQQQQGTFEQLNTQLDQYVQQQHEQQQQREQLQALQHLGKMYGQYVIELQSIEQQYQVDTQQLAELEGVQQQQKQDYQQQQQHVIQLQEILQQQRLLMAENVQSLRQSLKDKQPCMVCGSTEHPFAHQHFEQSIVDIQQQQVQSAQAKEQQAMQVWQETQTHCIRLQGAIQHAQQRQDHLKRELTHYEQQFQSKQFHVPENPIFLPQTAEQLTEFNEYCVQMMEQITQELQQSKMRIHQQQQAIQRNQQYQQEHARWQITQQQLQQLETLFTQSLAHMPPDEQKEIKGQWHTQGIAMVDQWIEAIQQRQQYVIHLHENQQQLAILQQQHATQTLNYQHLQERYTAQEQQIYSITQQGKEAKETWQRLIQQHQQQLPLSKKDLLDVSMDSALSYQQQLQQCVQHTRQQMDRDAQHQHQLAQQLQKDQLSYEHTQATLHALQHEQQHRNEQIEQWLQQHTSLDRTQLEGLIEQNYHQLIDDLTQKITQYQQETVKLHSEIQLLKQQQTRFQFNEMNYSTTQLTQCMEQLSQQIEQQSHQLDEQQQHYQHLNVQLQQDEQARQRYTQYEHQVAESRKQWHRWHRIADLIGSSKGEKFQRIAQQHHLDILLDYANIQLQQLSSRYELSRMNESLSLAITDHEMNDEVRSVLSLSGGESFLVALALALAIAHMASGAMKLETLFIDEGFGTLDPESLHMVMDALDRLQSQGRKVILISHIAEIQERIPVKIQVEHQGAGASRVVVGY